jgi:uncharacterized protein YegL
MAVSHGTAPAPVSFRARERTSHFLEIALKTGEAGSDASTSGGAPSLPVNFVFVIDTSGSMWGPKLDNVKTSIRELYGRLRDGDVLGLVTFDTQVRTLLPATPKHALPPERLAELVGGLSANGGTNLNLGIKYGIEEIRRHSIAERYVNCVYVFSDGDPTSGETDWIKIRTDVASRLRGDIAISCFGFGTDARMRELDALAGIAGGHSRFVTRPEDVRLDVTEDLTRRDHLAAINVQVKLDIAESVTVWHFYGHDLVTDRAVRAAVEQEAAAAGDRVRRDYGAAPLPDIITQESGIRVFTPDLAFGETYWIVLEIRLAERKRFGKARSADLGTAAIQYFDTVARQNRELDVALSSAATIPPETVLTHALGLRTSEVAFYAIDDLYQNDRTTAKERLRHHSMVLQAAHAHHPALQFQNDVVTLGKFMSLADDLGQPIRWHEDVHSPHQPVIFMMNAFGQTRGGHHLTRFQ